MYVKERKKERGRERKKERKKRVVLLLVALFDVDLGDRAKQPSALSRTLTRALNTTVPTVIAGQVKPITTTVEQPYMFHLSGDNCRDRCIKGSC